MKLFFFLGQFFILLGKVFGKPEKYKLYMRQVVREIDSIGIQSLGIIAIISFFMGAVVVIQTKFALDSPLLPLHYIGYTARKTVLMEFSSTIMALILAGKVGSRITSEIGSMRITEQIDALEIMGINSASYLILPKVVAAIFIFPFLTALSMFIAMAGGYLTGIVGGLLPSSDFLYGIRLDFLPFEVYYSLIKSLFFGFAIASIPAYFGYYANGGALDVGKAATKAVVSTSIAILILNYLLTNFLLV